MSGTLLTLALIIVSALVGALAMLLLRRRAPLAPLGPIRTQTVAERVRAVGKLVGLEVHAKEIATSTKGWSWIPPILLSQARIAMIFHFEKQYFVDLSRLRPEDVRELAPGEFQLRLPAVEGALRLTDVTPYDIQAGRVLGLLDVIQMNAETQRQLMQAAQEQAADLYTKAEPRYNAEAQRSIERQLESLLALFSAKVRVHWPGAAPPTAAPDPVRIERELEGRLTALASAQTR